MATLQAARDELIPSNDPYPLPGRPQIVAVTPEMASSWVSYRGGHPKLRPLSPSVSLKYKELMEAGRWREATPEGLIFDSEGWGISFQHRMKALANVPHATLVEKYGHPHLNFWVFPGEPRSIAPYLDQGHRRTTAHMLVGKPYAKDIGTAARHLAALADGDRWGMPRYNRVLVPEAVEAAEKWPELEWYPAEVWAVWRAAKIPAGAHLAVLAQAGRTEHQDKIPEWLEALRTGAIANTTDPRLILRERFTGGFVTLGKRPKRDQMYAQIVKAWNAYATGARLTAAALRLRSDETFPAVAGLGEERSAA